MAGRRPRHHGDPHLRTVVAALRPDRRRRARRHPRPAGDGVRRTRRSPAGHRSLHHHRLPGGLRAHGAVAGARPRARLVGVAADLRRHRAARGRRRRPGDGDRARRDDGRDGGPDPDRARCRQARLRRRPAVEGGAGRLHERPRDHDLRRPAPQARAGSRPTPTGSSTNCRPSSTDSPTGTRPRSWLGLATLAVLLVLPRVTRTIPAVLVAVVGATVVTGAVRSRHLDGRHAARGAPVAGVAMDERERRRTDAVRRRRHHPRLAHRHHRHLHRVRGTTRRGGEARIRR